MKSPKLYYLDVGWMTWLLDIGDISTLNTHALHGALYETFLVSELIKQPFNQGQH